MDKIKEIINKIDYATVATTSRDGQPWNSPVAAVHDDKLNYYWVSWRENQHSKNIQATGRAFIVVYDSTAPEGTGEGVYLQTEAKEVNDQKEVEDILRNTMQKTDNKPGEFLDNSPRRIYKASPLNVWLNDESEIDGHYIDVRKQVK